MKVSLLIDPLLTEKILEIKSELYRNGARIDGKSETGTPHIKIAEALDPPESKSTEITDNINSIFKKYEDKEIENFRLVNESREDYNWIALQIDEKWLRDLSSEIESYLDIQGINKTKEYKTKIYNLRKLDYPTENFNLDECIADHMNLVNKCRKDMATEAEKQFDFLKEISTLKADKLLFED